MIFQCEIPNREGGGFRSHVFLKSNQGNTALLQPWVFKLHMDIPKPERFHLAFHKKGGDCWNEEVQCQIEGHRDPQPPQSLVPYGNGGCAHDIEQNERTYDQVVIMDV